MQTQETPHADSTQKGHGPALPAMKKACFSWACHTSHFWFPKLFYCNSHFIIEMAFIYLIFLYPPPEKNMHLHFFTRTNKQKTLRYKLYFLRQWKWVKLEKLTNQYLPPVLNSVNDENAILTGYPVSPEDRLVSVPTEMAVVILQCISSKPRWIGINVL